MPSAPTAPTTVSEYAPRGHSDVISASNSAWVPLIARSVVSAVDTAPAATSDGAASSRRSRLNSTSNVTRSMPTVLSGSTVTRRTYAGAARFTSSAAGVNDAAAFRSSQR